MSTEFKIQSLPPQFEVENITILKALNAASRALGELRGEIKKIPNSQILIDTIALQEAKDSNEVENIVTTDDELYQSSVEFENVSQAAKEAQSYASALKLGFSIIKKNGILTTNDIKKIQEIKVIAVSFFIKFLSLNIQQDSKIILATPIFLPTCQQN